jgi:hypothetical protein
MGLPSFVRIWREIGVDGPSWRPEFTVPVRLGGETMLLLRDAKGVAVPSSTQNLIVEEIKPRDIQARLWNYLDDLDVTGDAQQNLLRSFVPVVQGEVSAGAKLLAVTGKVKGSTSLQAGRAAQSIEVLPASTYKVSFRFQLKPDNWTTKDRAYDSYGHPVAKFWTDLDRSQVDGWMSHLHWIFGSQVNIRVKLVSTDVFKPAKPMIPISSHTRLGSTGLTYTENTKIQYEPQVDDKADVTVFLTGEVDGGEGVTMAPRTRQSWAAYVRDNPHVPVTSNVDQFILTLAHEISHAIQLDSTNMHFCQDGVLRAQQRESTIIGDVLRRLLVARGGPASAKESCYDSADRADKVKRGVLQR